MNDPSPNSVPQQEGSHVDPARLIKRYQAGIWRYLRALGCAADLAEDITQETFLSVLEKPFNDYNPTATGAYLRKVARNLFITAMRRNGRLIHVEEADQLEIIWDKFAGEDNGEEMLLKLRDCLAALTDRARWALEMRFRDRLARTEIASQLGITEHGAKNLMQRAKHQLKKCIEEKTT